MRPFHDGRHTSITNAAAAGVSPAASIAITFDRYGHLMPGNEDEAAALLDAYVATPSPARLPQVAT